MENNTYVKYFDFDKINGNIMFRYRKMEIDLLPFRNEGKKKNKKIYL